MLTKLICRNFKNFGEVEIELGNPVVFIGPNNSGKTTALQALALWEIGLKRWNENRKGKQKTNYHTLVQYLPTEQVDPEVVKVLDSILEVANKAVPLSR